MSETTRRRNMRHRFEQQTRLGVKLISETPLPKKSRDDTPALFKALLKIYETPSYSNRIFDILEKRIFGNKEKTGRFGLNLWQIFVLAEVKLALKLDYDRLSYMVYSDSVLRQLLGIETETGFERIEIKYQRIVDNVHLLDDDVLKELNVVIVEMGHEVFKKKETEALCVKTDSFVVETDVHFPTDYNLLWDSLRKTLDIVKWFVKEYPHISGWRKINVWSRLLKNLSRTIGQISGQGGKNKEERLKKAVEKYLKKAKDLRSKVMASKDSFPTGDLKSLSQLTELERFILLANKHIDLLERRIIKGEKIPHSEKMFSIFEQHTEWIRKGKKRPSVELGKMVSITTDQWGLIIDHYVMEKETDSQIVKSTVDRVLLRYNIYSWSFDRGYWHKENKEYVEEKIPLLVMPKKGKPNKEEREQEQKEAFKKYKNKHSAVESNINELEHKGLDKCRDKGEFGFRRYVAVAVCAYNLHKIGKEILKQERNAEIKNRRKKRA